jgi:hypothetical protein
LKLVRPKRGTLFESEPIPHLPGEVRALVDRGVGIAGFESKTKVKDPSATKNLEREHHEEDTSSSHFVFGRFLLSVL